MICIEFVSAIKEFVIASAAVTGAIVAVKGLNTWRKQLKGHTEYELARRILVSLFKHRDAINGVRNSHVQLPLPSDDDAMGMSQQQITFYGFSTAYQERWDKVQEARMNLYPDLLEAEVLWGKDLNHLFSVVFKLENELFTSVRRFLELRDPNTSEESRDAILEYNQRKRDIMYSDPNESADEYQCGLVEAISKIETYLKSKLSY